MGDLPGHGGSAQRRSSATVRSAVLAAARQVFDEHGFAGARTREIASRAKVTEQMMFRHYPSKADLFEQAVAIPFGAVVSDYLRDFERGLAEDLPPEDLGRLYVSRLYAFMREHRRQILALIAAESHSPGMFQDRRRLLDGFYRVLEPAVDRGVAHEGTTAVNARLIVRLTFGMVLSAAVLDESILDLRPDQDSEQIVEELTAYVLAGVLRRP
ncbi:conserved hypothetical protein [Frankia canadensis]|uniref:HTH tetR-type domain-containing protein n=1 Tax=Frankia canadensis TaxID=1836972 RepID=A0A2I2L2Y5_9ACTN|nr:TetR/AcrR family transcriptional regulator [Frankia canadensis]SNQ52227.1 conserved hypothetical protein [Frankia canadensis]SOU59517.1 conserved hypothetical protein [Frankia canadensis]